ncbi:NrfD/PsrC family molybdoenzyme membrane anchor subunit [Carboxydothermus ferrireducens]|uniref:Molybdopterin-containing oxidoreductase family membrane subunit n=1 Tax=Carboxydothermus ferrireducens DSM 11255 TaxID=1119529 RepID=A0ABX2RFC0_9THEO|nr:NrfD/PsrC family molybdoenzyme membrane anchor subunit [Carboxydothermus ferrireducens]NYE58587.1 molybdopterin-containing oxidoreductase family membrane subunit [Carboxydothermus ferrireducens DSM 11255]
MKSSIRLTKAWYGVLVILMALGGWAIIERIRGGLAVTNLTSTTPWGAWVAFYIFFVGLSAGSFLLSTMIFVFKMEQYEKIGRDALLVAILSMVLAMCFILIDLGRMERFWHALRYWNFTSILAWEVRFYVVYIGLLMAELYFSMRQDLIRAAQGSGWQAALARFLTFGSTDLTVASKQRDHRLLKILGSIGIPVAIFGVHGGTGTLFAVAKARPFWNSGLFPVIFVVSALVSGTALLLAIYVIRSKVMGREVDKEMVKSLAGLLTLFLFIDLGLEFYEFFVGAYGLKHTELATIETIFRSPFSWSFWWVQLFLGVVVPLFIFFHPRLKESVNAIALAAILVVIGILGVRFNIVVPALIVPVLPGLPWGYYYPTLVEWLSSLGIVAFGLFLYTVAIKALPIDTVEELREGK